MPSFLKHTSFTGSKRPAKHFESDATSLVLDMKIFTNKKTLVQKNIAGKYINASLCTKNKVK